MRWTLVLVLSLVGCTPQPDPAINRQPPVIPPLVQHHATEPTPAPQPDRQARLAQLNAKYMGVFPEVRIGETRLALETQLTELNPEIIGENGKPGRNVWISGEAQFENVTTITYKINKGHDRYGFAKHDYVMVTYRDNVVVGFSR